MAAAKRKNEEEPKLVIKPVGRLGGLDNIHVAMLVVIGILIVLLAVISFSKTQVVFQNQTATTTNSVACAGFLYGGKCIVPAYNGSQAEIQVRKMLASYNYVNSSLSLLPYFSDVNNMSASYMPTLNAWLVQLRVSIPNSSNSFYVSFLLNGSNITDVTPYIQMAKPSSVFDSYVASDGVIKLHGKYQCSAAAPLQLYWFIDPYAPGALASLGTLANLQARYGSKINESIDIVYTGYTESMASTYGSQAYYLGKAILCAYNQSNFASFVNGLKSYSGFISNSSIYATAQSSMLNMTEFGKCMGSLNVTQRISAQGLLAKYYNITITPAVVTDCEYLSLPQTANNAICFANSTIC